MIKMVSAAQISGKKKIALLDTSSIGFMQRLQNNGVLADSVLKDYDMILIPEWVLKEINDSEGRTNYLQMLIREGYPIHAISEESYSELANNEEGNLYRIVLASVYQIAMVKSYLRRFVEKVDPLDMDEYKNWIKKLYNEWPLSGEVLSSGRMRKKNAGEVSITILAEVVSWYYPETEVLTIFSQDSDTYEFIHKAEENLRKVFIARIPASVSYKSNDVILCQLFREKKISVEKVRNYRTDMRRITYSKEKGDHSISLLIEVVDLDFFIDLIQDKSVQIIF